MRFCKLERGCICEAFLLHDEVDRVAAEPAGVAEHEALVEVHRAGRDVLGVDRAEHQAVAVDADDVDAVVGEGGLEVWLLSHHNSTS
jgi:hypothetical protein